MIKIGNIFEIPLSKGRFAYGQYVYKDRMGPIIQVFNIISKKRMQIDQLGQLNPLFPPIITALFAAINKGIWTVIGKKVIDNFTYPNFVSAYYDEYTGKANKWFIWNGDKFINIGTNLTDEYKKLEYLIAWNPKDVVNRIETGEYIFPFRELILFNKFTPKKQ